MWYAMYMGCSSSEFFNWNWLKFYYPFSWAFCRSFIYMQPWFGSVKKIKRHLFEFVWVTGSANACVCIANRFHFDLLHQYLLRLNGGLFFTAHFRHCKWFVAMNGWLILISAINAAAKNIRTHACTHTRTHKYASGWAQSVGQTEIMCKRCAWNEENWIELNVVFSAQFCILLRELYYVHVEYKMLFETCTHRERLGVTEESFALLLLLLYYIILCVGRAGAVVTIHVLCTQCVCLLLLFRSVSRTTRVTWHTLAQRDDSTQ